MYELVNTSVPNGLIAGTHGFATVAMTKGMPDAIRSRIENFCGYPHRTSSHDQSYWSENPANWFHLVLPGGDHAVGRTAPCDFDYTGRTNRISRILCFSAAEMPVSGGAYVLSAEARRFCEAWSGEPRYLKDDKVAAANLRMAEPASGAVPSHWIEMFGADGAGYARKFALLLAKNIMGGGKGIYFRASPAEDADGTRLLGIFSDLINLLPAELASKATFSTFAACVPGGVSCHLRGIYDIDRVFEAMSALQPWVDCASRTVKHAELLPEEEATHGGATSIEADAATSPDFHVRRQGRTLTDGGRPIQSRNVPVHPKKRSDSVVSFMVIAFVIVILIMLGCGAWWYFEQKRKWQGEDSKLQDEQILREKADEWHMARTDEIHKYEVDIAVRGTNIAELVKIANDVKAFKGGLDKSWKDKASHCGKTFSDESLLQGIKNDCDNLINRIGEKKNRIESERQTQALKEKDDEARKLKKKEDEERAKKEEKEREEQAKTADKAKADRKEITKKENEKSALRNKSLKELTITQVLNSETEVSSFIRRLDKGEQENLVEKGSIAVWFVKSKKLKSVNTELTMSKITRLTGGRNKEIIEYSFNIPEDCKCDLSWFVMNIVADADHRHVLWVWRDKWPVDTIFSDGKINKDKFVASCFGSEDAFKVWSKHANGNVYFEVSPKEDNKDFVYYADTRMAGDNIMQGLAELHIKAAEISDTPEQLTLKKEIENLKNDKEKLQQDKSKCDAEIAKTQSEVRDVENKVHRFNNMSKEEKSRIDKFGGKATKRGEALWEEIEKGCKQLRNKYNKDAKYHRDKIKEFLNEIKSAIKCKHKPAHDEEGIKKIDKKIDEKQKLLKSSKAIQAGASELEKGLWASQRYEVRVIGKIPTGYSLGWNRRRKVDKKEK